MGEFDLGKTSFSKSKGRLETRSWFSLFRLFGFYALCFVSVSTFDSSSAHFREFIANASRTNSLSSWTAMDDCVTNAQPLFKCHLHFSRALFMILRIESFAYICVSLFGWLETPATLRTIKQRMSYSASYLFQKYFRTIKVWRVEFLYMDGRLSFSPPLFRMFSDWETDLIQFSQNLRPQLKFKMFLLLTIVVVCFNLLKAQLSIKLRTDRLLCPRRYGTNFSVANGFDPVQYYQDSSGCRSERS